MRNASSSQFRNYFYTRTPAVNTRPCGSGNDNDEVDKRKFCPRCQFTLYYFEPRDLWFCGKCAWRFPDELLSKNREQGIEAGVKKGAATTTVDATNKEEDIV